MAHSIGLFVHDTHSIISNEKTFHQICLVRIIQNYETILEK